MDDKHINCKNCGAPLHYNSWDNRYKCDYCGSEYMVETNPLTKYENNIPKERIILIETLPPQYVTLGTKLEVSDTFLRYREPEEINKMIMEEICRQMAVELYKYITIDTSYDFHDMNQIYYGRLRIVPPKKEGQHEWMEAAKRIRR